MYVCMYVYIYISFKTLNKAEVTFHNKNVHETHIFSVALCENFLSDFNNSRNIECADINPFTPFSTVCLTPYRFSGISHMLDKFVRCCYGGFYDKPTNDLFSDTRPRKDGRTDVVFT